MKPKILLIYTGGTIGMVANPSSGELSNLDFTYIHNHIPELNRLDVSVTPISTERPIDSSHMSPLQWIEISSLVARNATTYDGFVILHGTDTMAYTASALSFLIQNLNKPIVLTGSQLPIGILRSDGKENLLAAIEIAGKKDTNGDPFLQEVAVFFQSKLFRGNRVSKVSAHQFDAFDSPNYPALGIAGVNIDLDPTHLLRPQSKELKIYTAMEPKIGLLKLYPGITLTAYESIFRTENHRAVIIETFGSGNTPNTPSFEKVLRKYISDGGVLVNVSQCTSGSIEPGKYASGHFLTELGAWNGKDLTTEAAVTKLMWLFGNNDSVKEIDFVKVYSGESL